MKAKIIILIIQIVMWAVMLGVGVWYLASSIGGTSLPYSSLPRFLNSIGACKDGVCDIASANGCFICPYVQKLFLLIDNATEVLWNAIIGNVWILLVVGLVIFMFWKAWEIITIANKENASLGAGARNLKFKGWFDAVRDQFTRVLFVGVLIGGIGYGGTDTLRIVSDVVIYPVMTVGTSLSMAASGMDQAAVCGMEVFEEGALLSGVSNSFGCVIGNLNAVILSGASKGFAMMNLAWMARDAGGFLTWLAGLAVVLMFLYIGFNVLFKVLNIIFNLVFIIIFLPLILAAFAFEKTWASIAGGVSNGAIGILARTAVRIIGITIEVMILYGLVSYAEKSVMVSDQVLEYEIVQKCETAAALPNGEVDKSTYISCFDSERAANPSAFQYLDRGWDFLVMLIFIFLVYYILVDKKLKKVINGSDDDAYFKFGGNLKSFGSSVWNGLNDLLKKLPIGKK